MGRCGVDQKILARALRSKINKSNKSNKYDDDDDDDDDGADQLLCDDSIITGTFESDSNDLMLNDELSSTLFSQG